MMFNASQKSRYRGGATQWIRTDTNHLFDVRVIIDRDVSGAHGSQHKARRWGLAAGIGFGGNDGFRECNGTVQGSLAGESKASRTGWQMRREWVLDHL